MSEVEFVEVISVVAVVASKNVQLIIIDYSTVGMARARPSLRVAHLLELPAPRVNAIPMEIIDAIEAIVPSEDENLSTVDDGCVAVAGRRRRIV